MDNPFDSGTDAYSRVRPDYPGRIVEQALAAPVGGTRRVVDLGAGTGKMTRLLLQRGLVVDAVEPAAAMRAQLASLGGRTAGAALVRGPARLRVLDATAERTGLAEGSEDLVVCAQAWHWLDEPAAAREAHRVLRPGGAVAIVWNQMDVAVPWIHRLTRIMRSGDVHRPDRPPHLGAAFTVPELTQVEWADAMTPERLMELGTTRSSYLRADPAQRRRMQGNLSWYLFDHRGLVPGIPVAIPYTTLLWTARRTPVPDPVPDPGEVRSVRGSKSALF
ncbi:class I SAM-dependent methyltransferase [Actinomyces provencensis]|uniref:class I SAM-dependent methyltransferase n=1 Tax=Actinomyces provencensis TaxID=1720198 RepID=UPI00096AAAF7|nr:class I SAM-dependent methyltransferase [Actinomyces provencensis]